MPGEPVARADRPCIDRSLFRNFDYLLSAFDEIISALSSTSFDQ